MAVAPPRPTRVVSRACGYASTGSPSVSRTPLRPYTVSWNTNTATNGPHSITAVARDAAGNTATSAPRSVTVTNDSVAPTVSRDLAVWLARLCRARSRSPRPRPTTPQSPACSCASTASRSAPRTPARPTPRPGTRPPCPTALTRSPLVARDPSGNTATSAPVSVTVQNAGPQPGAPVAAYSFDEGGGSTLFDRSGSRPRRCRVRRDVGRDRPHAPERCPSTASTTSSPSPMPAGLDLTSALTIEAWVRPTAPGGWQSLVLKERGADGLSYGLYASGADDPSGYLRVGNSDPAAVGPDPVGGRHLVAPRGHLRRRQHAPVRQRHAGGERRHRPGAIVTSTGALRHRWQRDLGRVVPGGCSTTSASTTGPSLAAEVAADRDTAVAGDEVAPSVPTGLTATGGQGSAQLSWTASTDNVAVTGYDIHRSTTSGFTISASTRVGTATSTSFNDAGLLPGTYHYRVVARDGPRPTRRGRPARRARPSPATPPRRSCRSARRPAARRCRAPSPSTAAATDAGGVAGVQLRLDGQPLGAEDTAAPYSVSWNTTGVANGSHTLTAVARDAAGQHDHVGAGHRDRAELGDASPGRTGRQLQLRRGRGSARSLTAPARATRERSPVPRGPQRATRVGLCRSTAATTW